MSPQNDASPERVLILTPTGRDARMVEARLVEAGFACEVCKDADALISALQTDAGALLIAEEALSKPQAEALLAVLDAQEPWSDIPALLLTLKVSKRVPHTTPSVALLERANIVLLQRPIPQHLLISAVRSAVRARRRQYQMRNLFRELSRAVQLSDMFVGILGHDLRTPLAAIQMSAEVIVRGSQDARALRPAGRILRSADRMTRMIEQLLDLARVRQGRGVRLQIVPTDLGEIARQVVQELGDAAPQARIVVNPSGDLNGNWDADRLAQVISNLVGNAVEHGAPNHPITVEINGMDKATVCLRVANQGAISQQALPTLFEPFKQSTTPKTREKGLGLGLFIAREIVRAHGGDIDVHVVDEQTCFAVKLPREARPIETDVLAAS